MKRIVVLLLIIFLAGASVITANAQCSICTKTASQLGEKPGRGLNTGIIYLMITPLAVGGFIGFRWWQHEKRVIKSQQEE